MKLNNMRIARQLRLGLGIIMALLMLLGALAWRATDLLWLQTKTFYDHPYQIRRAIGSLDGEIESISRHMRDLFLAENGEERAAALQGIEIKKIDAQRRFSTLYGYYLGPRNDVVSLEREFAKWSALRDETLWLLRSGDSSEARRRIRPGGIQEIQAEVVRGCIQRIDRFAMNKGDQLYQAASEQKDSLNLQLVTIILVSLLLSLVISWLLLKGIKEPLNQLTNVANQFRLGNMAVRSSYSSENELGILTSAFNSMADTVERQMIINEKSAKLVGVMLREIEARAFCREFLKALLDSTSSQIGAIYFLNPQKSEFDHFESIGLGGEKRGSFSAALHEGEFGRALASRQMERITEISEDTCFELFAVSGKFKPREIITIPIFAGEEAVAMVSLASLNSYHKESIQLIESVLSTLTARMNGVLAFRHIQELADRLQQQNRELEAQKQELAAQTEELTEMNTELEMQKRQLDEASRLKSAFLSTMSHELRTPLNSVIALSAVLSRRLAGAIPEDELSYLEVIERNGKNLLLLINDILDLSRIESGYEEINLGKLSFRELVEEVVAMIEPQAQERKIALINRVDEYLPMVTSDPDKCRHILQNLVSNAVKFTEVGTVEIAASQVDGEIHLTILDTGIGIAADQLAHIFEEFRQADDSASRKYGGTGLGLAIARKYAALLHGSITVKSRPGDGSLFTFILPINLSIPGVEVNGEVASSDDTDRAATWQSQLTYQGQWILIVDDSEPAVIQMTDILTSQGYNVRVARNGHDALDLIEQYQPDGVILDIMMPQMDGFEVLRQIRTTESSARLPVLMLTAKHVTREELSFLKGNHIHQLIQKGDVSRSELLAAVARMVAPPSEPSSEQSTTHIRKKDLRSHRKRPTILVVEDNIDNLQTMRALLQDSGTVIEAADGRMGLELAMQQIPDIILMDLALPVMDGFSALTAIRAEESLSHIPVVAVTASAMKGDREKILAHGFDGYISKPIDAKLLQGILEEVLHGSR